MAAGLVYHNITTASGVTFTIASWVPDTSAPDVGAIPVHVLTNSAGAPLATGSGANGVTVQRVAMATDSPDVTSLATLAGIVNSGKASVTIDPAQVGNLVSADFVKASNAVPVMLPSDQAPLATKDAGPNWTSVWGVSGVPVTTATTFSTTAVTAAPTSGQKLCIDDIIVSTDAATKITFLEETSGTVMFGPWYLPANSGPMQISVRGKKKLATADKKLVATSVGSANVTVQVGYHSEA